MELVRIPEPHYAHVDFDSLFGKYRAHKHEVLDYVQRVSYPEYLAWDKARFVTPPAGFSREEAWYLAHEIRTANAQALPIRTPAGGRFTYVRLNYTDQYLNQFDLLMGGQLLSSKVRITASEHQMFMARGVIEEAIASSQLEGASVTRKDAKEMIAENRTPRNESEWMAVNNYRMMMRITEVYKDVPLSRELLLEMHQVVSANTMEADDIGRFRQDSDPIRVGTETVTTYIPPKHDFLMHELDALIAFANDNDPEHFMHPVIKAVVLHFWIGYLHPFVDGNGRIARALFYWLLLKKGYWLSTYVPISTIIKRAPIQYSNAYVFAEQDNNDFTYFFDYHMHKIKRASDEFLAYVQKQQSQNREIDGLLEVHGRLNERQKQAMHYLLANQRHRVSITSHSGLNGVSLNTARNDLLSLQKAGLIFPLRSGKFVYYHAKPLE
jgi:Fic family protein